MERGIRAAVALGLVWWRPATGRVAGGGARWRAGHRGAPVRRRQGRRRLAAYRERGTGRGIEREKQMIIWREEREKREREIVRRERVCGRVRENRGERDRERERRNLKEGESVVGTVGRWRRNRWKEGEERRRRKKRKEKKRGF